jgi:hypothetical protein
MITAILCGLGLLILVAGGILYAISPDMPEPRNGMPDIVAGRDQP